MLKQLPLIWGPWAGPPISLLRVRPQGAMCSLLLAPITYSFPHLVCRGLNICTVEKLIERLDRLDFFQREIYPLAVDSAQKTLMQAAIADWHQESSSLEGPAYL